jgi:DNA-binding NtrC family response regulator
VDGAFETMVGQTSKTVLLAEDNDGIRRLLTTVLTGVGANVIVASSRAEAQEKAREHQGKIDLLISNVGMREMSGIQLAQHLCGDRPGLKVLLISSATEDPLVRKDGWLFLQKPFQIENFTTTVHAMLQTVTDTLDQSSHAAVKQRPPWDTTPVQAPDGRRGQGGHADDGDGR